MSATPIPRTLAIILYGDLDISVIDELAGRRLPIKNCVVDTSYRPKAYRFIETSDPGGPPGICDLSYGRRKRGYGSGKMSWIIQKKLKDALPEDISVEFLHGKMKPKEKNRIMEEFAAGSIQVLVSTTVVEVGVNVPNATVMMIENAERFGLAQLHQLRGRWDAENISLTVFLFRAVRKAPHPNVWRSLGNQMMVFILRQKI